MRKLAVAGMAVTNFVGGFTVEGFVASDQCLDADGRWDDRPLLGVCESFEP